MERTIENLEQELKSEHDLYLRALADFDNFRRRIDRERAVLGFVAGRKFILGLLDIMDDLDRFLNFVENEISPFVDGIRVVHQKLLKLFESEGVRPFDSVGKPFDPTIHEAVATQPAGDRTEGIIVQEFRRGYKWNDELLRSARVVVTV